MFDSRANHLGLGDSTLPEFALAQAGQPREEYVNLSNVCHIRCVLLKQMISTREWKVSGHSRLQRVPEGLL